MTPYAARDISALNTLAVPATAAHFAVANSVAAVQDACAWARKQGTNVLVLGGGSNILAASHIAALVLQPALRGVTPVKATAEHQWIDVGAGENWHELVLYCLKQGWYGLENLSLIPGTVGAAPIQNIGAYGVELSQLFDSLQAVHIETGHVENFDLAHCAFGYRNSIFKKELRSQYAITRVRLRLSREPHVSIQYPALKQALAGVDEITPRQVSNVVCALRRSKLPDPLEQPNVGSFFKNPVVSQDHSNKLRKNYPDLVAFSAPGGKKLAAGWLIEQAGWKGKTCGGIVIHASQALVLTNPHRLPTERVLAAARAIQASVEQLFGVKLEIEPQLFP